MTHICWQLGVGRVPLGLPAPACPDWIPADSHTPRSMPPAIPHSAGHFPSTTRAPSLPLRILPMPPGHYSSYMTPCPLPYLHCQPALSEGKRHGRGNLPRYHHHHCHYCWVTTGLWGEPIPVISSSSTGSR